MPRRTTHITSSASSSDSVDVVHADQRGPLLPTELTHEIVGLVLAKFLTDLVLLPQSAKEWDAALTLLQVSRTFRACTVKYMTALWGGEFPVGRRSDYKKSISLLRRYSELARTSPNQLFDTPVPQFLNDRIIRNPRIPIISILKCLTSSIALTRLWDDDADIFSEPPDIVRELRVVVDQSKTISPGVRRVLFPYLEDYTVSTVLPWARAWVLRGTLQALYQVFVGITLAEFSFLEDSQDMMDFPREFLRAAEALTKAVTDVVDVFGFPLDVIDRDIVTEEFAFHFEEWNLVMQVLNHIETLTVAKRAACMIWKRTFALLMSKADRKRVMPDFSMDKNVN